VIFGILALIENFLFGLIKNWWEIIGYCIGAIFGIYILASLINAVFPGAILATVFSIIIIGFGVGVRIWLLMISSRSGENYDYGYP
jgi:predicted MFS family arabinose efflux permease